MGRLSTGMFFGCDLNRERNLKHEINNNNNKPGIFTDAYNFEVEQFGSLQAQLYPGACLTYSPLAVSWFCLFLAGLIIGQAGFQMTVGMASSSSGVPLLS